MGRRQNASPLRNKFIKSRRVPVEFPYGAARYVCPVGSTWSARAILLGPPGKETQMSTIKRLIAQEDGSEIMEYALILGLIAVATIAAIAMVGTKILTRWNSVSGASF